jgi:hypothetical protein
MCRARRSTEWWPRDAVRKFGSRGGAAIGELYVKPLNTMKRCLDRQPAQVITLYLSVALLFLLSFPVHAGDSAVHTAKVIALKGSARYDTNQHDWYALHLGDELSPTFLLHTAAKGSMVDIRLGGDEPNAASTVRVFSNSVMSVIKLTSRGAGSAEVKEIELALIAGQILLNLNSAAENEVRLTGAKTPMRLISHRRPADREGTVCLFKPSGALTVLQGSATVSTDVAKDQAVKAGEQLDGESGEVTKLPLDAPEWKLWP